MGGQLKHKRMLQYQCWNHSLAFFLIMKVHPLIIFPVKKNPLARVLFLSSPTLAPSGVLSP